MDNTTIYHQVKGMVIWSKWIRIFPVYSVQVQNDHTNVLQNQTVKDKYLHNQEAELHNVSYYRFKFSHFQFAFNFGILIVLAAIGCFGQAILYNLTKNATQQIGFVVNIFTLLILPLTIIFYCNRNTPKVSLRLK